MNKQIQELKNQCWVEKHWDKENERWIDRHIDLDKFAELIVRECAEVLDTWNKENGVQEGLDKAGLISLWSPHFGVEE